MRRHSGGLRAEEVDALGLVRLDQAPEDFSQDRGPFDYGVAHGTVARDTPRARCEAAEKVIYKQETDSLVLHMLPGHAR